MCFRTSFSPCGDMRVHPQGQVVMLAITIYNGSRLYLLSVAMIEGSTKKWGR